MTYFKLNDLLLKSTSCLICLIVCSCQGPIQDEQKLPTMDSVSLLKNNLLKNGSLEKWYFNDVLESWSYNNENVKQECDCVYDGCFSAKISSRKRGETAKIYQRIPITSGHYLRICYQYYIKKGSLKCARMYCSFCAIPTENISNNDLTDIYDSREIKIIHGGGYGESYIPLKLGTWQTFDYVIKAPDKANYFVFEVHSYYGTTMYLDNCCVIDIGV